MCKYSESLNQHFNFAANFERLAVAGATGP